jgi:hypothetical protein
MVCEIQQDQFSDVREKEMLSDDLLLKIRSKVKEDKRISREHKNIVLEELHI